MNRSSLSLEKYLYTEKRVLLILFKTKSYSMVEKILKKKVKKIL